MMPTLSGDKFNPSNRGKSFSYVAHPPTFLRHDSGSWKEKRNSYGVKARERLKGHICESSKLWVDRDIGNYIVGLLSSYGTWNTDKTFMRDTYLDASTNLWSGCYLWPTLHIFYSLLLSITQNSAKECIKAIKFRIMISWYEQWFCNVYMVAPEVTCTVF